MSDQRELGLRDISLTVRHIEEAIQMAEDTLGCGILSDAEQAVICNAQQELGVICASLTVLRDARRQILDAALEARQ
tara:strand:- start:614 stop:844 length:231 start_codon:yes stop_codon:yes gene_type:complete